MNMFAANDQILQYPAPLGSLSLERKWKSNVELAPNCPRCASANTKFCYYNNYSLSQPRYFCKGCRRYWTKGGSLRNVPVGGGCRKNRRGKSARQSTENDRNAMSYSKSFSSFGNNTKERPDNPCSSDDGDSSHKPSGGSDIDLALVFAKFLKQSSPSFEPEFSGQELANAANSSTPDRVENDFATIESQNPSDDHQNIIGDANLLLEEFPHLFDVVDEKQQEGERSVQDWLENDMNAYGLQTMLSDEIAQDVLWTEQAETLPNFTWQPMFQLQDFDSFPADGTQLMASANLVSDNWGSFDLSGFEVYSRPY